MDKNSNNKKELTTKERMQIRRQPMPLQPAAESILNFNEVATGYTQAQACLEAERCLQCKHAPCVNNCPVNVAIPDFIKEIREGNLHKAAAVLKTSNSLPAICGRVCPQETQCEAKCILSKKGEPVAIGRLERYVADWFINQKQKPGSHPRPNGKSVAVIGSGPAGLTCAADLARMGYKVVVFEALHQAGGVLVYGIPEFRLPKSIVDTEIETIQAMGVEMRLNQVIGKLYTLNELLEEHRFDAVFLGTGAGLPVFIGVPGENLNGVFSSNEFLTRVNLMKGYLFPEWDTPVRLGKKIAVIGAGNVAMDSARCALRLATRRYQAEGGAKPEVHIIYRRSREEMPARQEEIEHAREEGVQLHLLCTPLEISGDKHKNAAAVKCIRNKLGETDSSGRRRPVPLPGTEFSIDTDTVILAIGTQPNPLVFFKANQLTRSKWGTVIADNETGLTEMDKVWAGGDIVTGAATVISAMGAGKKAAAHIDTCLKN